ncbi:single-stranded DNA-binding protein [Candidatus Collinsella stercoripullorum]|uniref:single-stranded DNA-binding protein n=1 Tax=Candidatus Collinsella stercoripullorum TaxID=2838522 RepID=UPI0022E1EBA3|nr:single-stranded DNA-binding protein [Candidatus Collinsella stercoripullorum]
MSINQVSMSGNLGADAELRSTRGGTPVLTFALAVNERVKQADGTWGDRASWIDCVLFGARAQALADWLRKGNKVAVQGRLRTSTWESDGVSHKRTEVVVEEVDLMTVKRDRQQGTAQNAPGVYDEDVPF